MPDTYEPQTDLELEKLVDHDAEQSLLGNIMAEPSCFDAVAWFKPEFFGLPVHGEIFRAIKTFRQQGRDFGYSYISEFFANDPALIVVGGQQYLKTITLDAFAPSSVKDLAAHLLSLHYRRLVLCTSRNMHGLATSPDLSLPPEKVLESVEVMIAEARGLKTHENISSASDSAIAALDMARNPTYGISSGFSYLQKITGGFKPSQLVVIGGRPGMGKTAMGLTLAVNACEAGKQVLFFSLEMSREELMQRVLSRYSRQAVHSGQMHNEEAVEQAVVKASRLSMHIDDTPGITALDVSARATSFKRRHGLDMVVIDYLGLVKATDPRANKVHQIEEVTQAFKALAKTLRVPVILLCQLSRPEKGNEAKRPGLSDLRDSGAIEQDADMVMFVYREEYYNAVRAEKASGVSPNREAAMLADAHATKGAAELIIAKNRQSVLDTVFLRFSGEEQCFYEG